MKAPLVWKRVKTCAFPSREASSGRLRQLDLDLPVVDAGTSAARRSRQHQREEVLVPVGRLGLDGPLRLVWSRGSTRHYLDRGMAPGRTRATLTIMTKTLDGKVALVTGASRGIGAAIAKRLARDGASVAITFNSSPDKALEVVRAIEAEGVKGLAIQADAGDADAVRRAVQQVVTELGRIDVLVNNAGVVTASPFDQVSIGGLRAAARGERARRVRGDAGGGEAHDRGRPRDHDGQHQRRFRAVPGHLRLRADEGGPRRPHARRSRASSARAGSRSTTCSPGPSTPT